MQNRPYNRHGPGGEWQTAATGDTGGEERVVFQMRLKINLEKTEVLHRGHQREQLDIKPEGKKLTRGRGDSFVYLGGSVWRREDGERGMYIYFEEHRPSERVESS